MTAQLRALGIPEILELILNHIPINDEPKRINPVSFGPLPLQTAPAPRVFQFRLGYSTSVLADPPQVVPHGIGSGFSSQAGTGSLRNSNFASFGEGSSVTFGFRTDRPQPSNPTSKGTLLAVALSCRLLSPSAIRILWRSMSSLQPLISILPLIVRDGQRVLAPQISSETWARFDTYRYLIRVLTFEDSTVSGRWVSDPLWATILAIKPVPLPQLHTLIIPTFHNDMSLNSLTPYLASPLLQNLEVKHIANRGAFVSFCSLFHYAASNSLHSLKIHDFVTPGDVDLIISPALRTMQSDLIQASDSLKSLPSLQHLHLHLSGEVGHQPLPLTSLRSLNLSGTNDAIVGFLSSCECSLEMISISLYRHFYSEDGPGDMPKILFSIMREKWAHSLRHIELSSMSGQHPTNAEWDNFMETVEPILDLPLISLRFLNFPFKLGSNTSIVSIASHFPLIQSLVLPRRNPGIGLDELFELAVSCPSLEHLGSSVSIFECSSQLQSSSVLTHGLKTLDVLDSFSYIFNPEDTALGLDRIFPSLNKIEDSLGSNLKWKEVEKLLKLFRRARERS
ncbi:hypothetical protein BDN72DRAFT_901393 [Pluteus cervinus]|uniref:Uncharacterized protein n=1 Tax=Pluteus cervinus TaxID=181527 RepID=A0ACD3AFK4_9AGAR|nr:hypothetical protein BDN72DRAFT_901393 [Pluteus cervinus]